MTQIERVAVPSTATFAPLPSVAEESVGCCGLRGRVRTGPPGTPRAGLLERLGSLLQSVVTCFRPGVPDGGRLPRKLPSLSAQERLGQCIEEVATALTSGDATSEAIAAALGKAAAAAHETRREGGSPRGALEDFTRRLREATTTDQQLLQLARAFGGPAVAGGQKLTQENAAAQHLLMSMEIAVNAELTRREEQTRPLSAAIDAALATAVASTKDGRPNARIGDQLHAAVDSAMSLVKAGIRHTARTQTEVDRLVLERLAQLPPQQLARLLVHARSEDLDRLRRVGDPPGPATAAIEAETATRVPRRVLEFRERALQICEQHAGAASLDCHAFHDDLIALGTSVRQLDAHCRLFAQDNPLANDGPAQWPRGQLASLVESAFGAHGINPHMLSTRELARLSDVLHALGLHDLTHSLLGEAQQACLARQRDLFRERFTTFVTSVVAAGASPEGSRRLLCQLAELEDAARALQDARLAFDRDPAHHPSSSKAPSGAATGSPGAVRGAQGDLIQECLAAMPDEAVALESMLGMKGQRGLISALHVGAALASEAQERQMEERFANMARLCEQLARESGAARSGGSGSAAPAQPVSQSPDSAAQPLSPTQQLAAHQQIATENLSPAMRRALREDYGLLVPTHGPPALQSGRLTASQVQNMALEFERPLSEWESRMASVGPHRVGAEFYLDAMRGFPLHVGDPAQTPAPDHERVPVPAQTPVRHLRPLSRSDAADPRPPLIDRHDRVVQDEDVQAVFTRLLELCGNEERARIVTLYATQRILLPFLVTCYHADPPILYLADGTPGLQLQGPNVRDPLRSGVTDHRQISVYMGGNGRPQLEVDYRMEGRAMFAGIDGSQTYLSPDSHMQVHIRAEIDPHGRLLLLEAPSYRLDLRADDFQKPYRPPTVGDVVATREGKELFSDLMTYSRGIGAQDGVVAFLALAQFKRHPTRDNAAAVVLACDTAAPAVRNLVPEELRAALSGEESETLLAPDLFGALEPHLTGILESQVLPGMIAAVRRGELSELSVPAPLPIRRPGPAGSVTYRGDRAQEKLE
jgi:hypothetical protein